MKIAVIGTGYIGLVSGICLANIGHEVICVDNNEAKVLQLKAGDIPIYEPGLADLLSEVRLDHRLSFTTDTVAATRKCDVIFIAVGTPTSADGATSDLSHVFAVAAQTAKGFDTYKVVVIKSTVPVGTGKRVRDAIAAAAPGAEFDVVSNPEFLREGAAVFDFMNPDRIVVGAPSARARAMLDEIYQPLTARGHFMLHTSAESAELIKFASNGFLATKIAFINEMAHLCEKTGADVHEVARGMGLDERIGPRFLNAGPGYGGSCFPKDTRALAALGRAAGAALPITEAVVESNEAVKRRMVDIIVRLCGGSVMDKKLAVFGVTFKAETDDMREAPALTILPELQALGARISVSDPQGQKHGEALLPGIAWIEDPYQCATDADAIVVLTEWQHFRALNLARLAGVMREPLLADLRNIYDVHDLKAAGFKKTAHIGMPFAGQ